MHSGDCLSVIYFLLLLRWLLWWQTLLLLYPAVTQARRDTWHLIHCQVCQLTWKGGNKVEQKQEQEQQLPKYFFYRISYKRIWRSWTLSGESNWKNQKLRWRKSPSILTVDCLQEISIIHPIHCIISRWGERQNKYIDEGEEKNHILWQNVLKPAWNIF